jgi:hypothetical protein
MTKSISTETATTTSPELLRAEAEVAASRERVAQSVMALRQEVARRTDWRAWIARRPFAFLGGGLLLGVWLGYRGGRGGKFQREVRTWK